MIVLIKAGRINQVQPDQDAHFCYSEYECKTSRLRLPT